MWLQLSGHDLETDSSLSDTDAFMAAAMEDEHSSHPNSKVRVARLPLAGRPLLCPLAGRILSLL